MADQQADCYELYYKDKNPDPEHTIRIYKNREEVNLPCIMEGRLPESADEIALDRLYAENNKIRIGDIVPLEGKKLTVCGTVALSDYSTMYRNNNDMMFNASLFSVALMTPEGFESLDDTGLVYCYAWRFQEASADDTQERERCDDMLDAVIASILGMPQEEAEKQAEEVGTLVTFLHMLGGAEDSDYIEKSVEDSIDHFVGSGRNEILDFVGRPDNNAIVFTIDDIVSDQVFTNFFLYILILILAFIYAVTTRNTIEQEASVIGTLRASGYTREELLAHPAGFRLYQGRTAGPLSDAHHDREHGRRHNRQYSGLHSPEICCRRSVLSQLLPAQVYDRLEWQSLPEHDHPALRDHTDRQFRDPVQIPDAFPSAFSAA